MNTTNTNAQIVARRRLSPWAALTACLIAGFATGLFTGKSLSHPSTQPTAVAARADQAAAAAVVDTYPIVPSAVIDLHPNFFYGTGDGNGTYSDR
jgi:hypothetical protein